MSELNKPDASAGDILSPEKDAVEKLTRRRMRVARRAKKLEPGSIVLIHVGKSGGSSVRHVLHQR